MSSNNDVPQRASRQMITADDPALYNTRPPTAAVRWNRGQDVQQIIEQGDKRVIIHQGLPAVRRGLLSGYRGMIVGVVLTFVLLWLGSMGINWWNNWRMDVTYGYPRIWQTDAVVGHGDSSDHPSHFQFQNLYGHVLIIEISGGNPAHSHIYVGPTLAGDGADRIPITGTFDDETGKGTTDMIVLVNGQRIVYLNTGTEFKQQ